MHRHRQIEQINSDAPITVVVIGAGLSGLSAAQQILRRRPRTNLIVLEAMQRVGGRTHAKAFRGALFDVGGTMVGPHQINVLALAERAKEEMMRQPRMGRKIMELGGQIGTYEGDFPTDIGFLDSWSLSCHIKKINRMAKEVPWDCPSRCPNAYFWDSTTVYTWLHSNIWMQRVRRYFEVIIRACYGVEPSEISMLYLLWTIHQYGSFDKMIKTKDGHQDLKFVRGANTLSHFLQKQIKAAKGEIRLGCQVDTVKRLQDLRYEVSIKNHKGTAPIQCDYVVVALPPAHVKRITFIPKLSTERQMVCQKSFMGSSIKILLFYNTPFWIKHGYSGDMFSDCKDGPILYAHDQSRPRENGEMQPALAVYLNGAVSRHWGARDDLLEKVQRQIKRYFGYGTPDPEETYIQNWDSNEMSRGGPKANFGPGLLSQVEKLTKSQGGIHWAGAELAYQGYGTMDGAIQSGLRAADEILAEISGQTIYPSISSVIKPPVGWYDRLLESQSWMHYLFG